MAGFSTVLASIWAVVLLLAGAAGAWAVIKNRRIGFQPTPKPSPISESGTNAAKVA